MKILQIIPNISGGGAERLVVDLSNHLAKAHDVTILTLYDPSDDDLFRDQIAYEVKTQSLGKQLGFDLKVIPNLYKAINKKKPDIIHNHLRSFNYLMPSIPFLDKMPIIHTVHNDAFKECSNSKIRKVRKLFFERTDIVPVTISNESANSFSQAYKDIKYKLIYNGRRLPVKSQLFHQTIKEVSDYKQDSNTKVFVTIGRLQPQKNQLMLVKAFNQLIYKDDANAILIIIGKGRNNESSLKIQKKLHRADQEHGYIVFLGECHNATDYLYTADYFCLSSIYEGMPITLIEAFATGTIPVCTPVGGIPEMVHDLDSSLVSKSVDVNDYYKALKRAYNISLEKQEKLKQQVEILFEERYSMRHCAEQYLNLYKKLRQSYFC